MKALIIVSAIAKSSSFARRAAFVAPIHHRVAENEFQQQRRRRSTAVFFYHVRPPIHSSQRYCTTLFNNVDANNCEETSRIATATNELDPFTWSDITDLFTDPHDSRDKINNYIPSNHPNLALFRRSTAAQDLYEEHKLYLSSNWKSPYDYLVYSKFGEEFGFEKELVQVDDPGLDRDVARRNTEGNGLSQSPEGFRYQCNPSLSQASDYTTRNGMTYLKLVLNDFPYDVQAGIHHWCLWKVGGKCRTEGILREELLWALRELNSYPSDSIGCSSFSSSLIVKQNELTESESVAASSLDKLSTFYWVNPPHLQSSKYYVFCCLCIAGGLLDDDQLQYTKICSEIY